jgi:uncharacterized membrane protein
MIVLDAPYLYYISPMFKSMVKTIQGTEVELKLYAAVICYFLISVGVHIFLIEKDASLLEAFLLGILVYGVFEATSMSVFDKWSPVVAGIDTLWGGILFFLVVYIKRTIVN